MKKKIYLNVDWESRSIGVSSKESWEEYKKYLEGEDKCEVYVNGDSIEIYDGSDRDSSDGMVELKIEEKDLY